MRIGLFILIVWLVVSSCRGQERADEPHAEPAPASRVLLDAGARVPGSSTNTAVVAAPEDMAQSATTDASSTAQSEVAIERLVRSDAIYAISAVQTVLRDRRRDIPECDKIPNCDTRWADLSEELPDDAVRISIDKEKARAFLNILSSPDSYGGAPAGCYDPRLQVAFYRDGETTPWATVGVCIECMNTYSWPAVSEVAEAPNDKTGYGLRPTGVRAWCREVGLESCVNHRTYVEKQ